MSKTRLSPYYLTTYLWLGGLGLLFAPTLALNLLLSNADYPAVMLQAAGMFMIGLGVLVTGTSYLAERRKA